MKKKNLLIWIEDTSLQMLNHNPFAIKAREGKIAEVHLLVYLNSMMYNIRHTPIFLKTAIDSSKRLGLHELAGFLADKLKEETGHDAWVRTDLEHLNLQQPTAGNLHDAILPVKNLPTTNAILAMVDYLKDRVNNAPIGFLGYVVFLEYFTVLTTPRFLHDLETFCGIPRDKLSALVKHGELDKAHAQENFDALDELLNSDEKWKDFMDTMQACTDYLNQHFIECAAAA